MNSTLVKITLGFFITLSAYATTDHLKIMQQIDPLCFNELPNDSTTLNLNQCGLKSMHYATRGKNEAMVKKNYIGFEWEDIKDPEHIKGYSYYKFFNAGNDGYWVYSINNGGGSGEFTSIYWVKPENEQVIKIKSILGGDRCNGGIQDVASQNNHLTFSVNLTAFDLIALAKNPDPKIKVYDNLAACAVCCVAKAFYELDSNFKLQLKYVDLGKTSNIDELPNQGTLQAHFNKVLVSYVTKGQTHLNQEQLEQFVTQFKAEM